jgi:hypothetical protein
LALVHDFLNTVAIYDYPDLLADTTLADDWAANALQAWSAIRCVDAQPPSLTETDLARLRSLRGTIAKLVTGEPTDGRGTGSVSASFALSGGGDVRLEPSGAGWRWLASLLWSEILLSHRPHSPRARAPPPPARPRGVEHNRRRLTVSPEQAISVVEASPDHRSW